MFLSRGLELVGERPRAEGGYVGDDAARVEHAGARPPQDVGELRPRRRRLDDDHEVVEDHGRSCRCRDWGVKRRTRARVPRSTILLVRVAGSARSQ